VCSSDLENQKAISELKSLADFILVNDRDIIQPQDDSVLKFTKKHQKKVVIRRSRGHEIGVKNFDFSEKKLLAMGANMKSTFALKTNYNVYASQYLGDLQNFETQQNYLLTLNRFLGCYTENNLESPVDKVIVDLHPGYFSAEFGKTKAEEWGLPIQTIQHHEAHFSAVLAENDLLEVSEKILGVVWDGTGLGTDGNVWGGEFFVYENKEIVRVYHFGYFDSILNDKMAKEPRLSALSLLIISNIEADILIKKFTKIEFDYFRKTLLANTLKTCSVGRIFDGVASILGLIDVQTYEGEAAMLLENLAFRFFNTHGFDWKESYFYQSAITELNITQTLVSGIVNDLKNGKERAFIAAKFHISLVDLVGKIAENNAAKFLTFSGGVFQNTLLVDTLIEHLQGRFTLFFHKDLSPNDESISYGQIFHPSIN
jgi:hydrogenase maturation protein HypF